MEKKVILIGHGHYASGMKSACELIAGPRAHLVAIDFGIEEEKIPLKTSIQMVLDQNENTPLIFICDLVGGTPFKTAVEMTQDRAETVVLAGVNVSGLLELVLQKDFTPLEKLVMMAVEQTQNSVVAFQKKETVTTVNRTQGI